MSDSKSQPQRIGFSTGALEKGNYRQAVRWLRNQRVHNVEISALRLEELEPLVNDLESLPLGFFSYVSFHAPSSFPATEESNVVKLLGKVFKRGWNIIVHPDVIRRPALWRHFGRQLLVENMDRRKAAGRTASELEEYFRELPQARLCLDVAHARQLDTTLTVLTDIIGMFRSRLGEVHISELDSHCSHTLMSALSIEDYLQVMPRLSRTMPVIIESMLDGLKTGTRMNELSSAEYAMGDRRPPKNIKTFYCYLWANKAAEKNHTRIQARHPGRRNGARKVSGHRTQ